MECSKLKLHFIYLESYLSRTNFRRIAKLPGLNRRQWLAMFQEALGHQLNCEVGVCPMPDLVNSKELLLRTKFPFRQSNKGGLPQQLHPPGSVKLPTSRMRLVGAGDRTLPGVGSRLWNSLPDELRLSNLSPFRATCKTHLSVQAAVLGQPRFHSYGWPKHSSCRLSADKEKGSAHWRPSNMAVLGAT